MKTSIVNVNKKLLTNIVEERVASLNDIDGKDLKKQLKLLAQQSEIPFFSYGVGCMNTYCHIHESYSISEYKKMITK